MDRNETRILDAVEVRDTDTYNSGSADFGKRGFSKGVMSIENFHNEIFEFQMQGRADRGTVWQNIGVAILVAAVAAGVPGVGNIGVTVPWNRLRLQYATGDAPVSGYINAWLNAAIY